MGAQSLSPAAADARRNPWPFWAYNRRLHELMSGTEVAMSTVVNLGSKTAAVVRKGLSWLGIALLVALGLLGPRVVPFGQVAVWSHRLPFRTVRTIWLFAVDYDPPG